MTKNQAKRVDPLALLVFYGAIGMVGILVGFLVSLVVLPSSPAARLALMVGSVVLAAWAIDLSLKRLIRWASKHSAETRTGRQDAAGQSSRLDRLYPLIDALVRIGSHGHQPR